MDRVHIVCSNMYKVCTGCSKMYRVCTGCSKIYRVVTGHREISTECVLLQENCIMYVLSAGKCKCSECVLHGWHCTRYYWVPDNAQGVYCVKEKVYSLLTNLYRVCTSCRKMINNNDNNVQVFKVPISRVAHWHCTKVMALLWLCLFHFCHMCDISDLIMKWVFYGEYCELFKHINMKCGCPVINGLWDWGFA